jgi:hypothetical protein
MTTDSFDEELVGQLLQRLAGSGPDTESSLALVSRRVRRFRRREAGALVLLCSVLGMLSVMARARQNGDTRVDTATPPSIPQLVEPSPAPSPTTTSTQIKLVEPSVSGDPVSTEALTPNDAPSGASQDPSTLPPPVVQTATGALVPLQTSAPVRPKPAKSTPASPSQTNVNQVPVQTVATIPTPATIAPVTTTKPRPAPTTTRPRQAPTTTIQQTQTTPTTTTQPPATTTQPPATTTTQPPATTTTQPPTTTAPIVETKSTTCLGVAVTATYSNGVISIVSGPYQRQNSLKVTATVTDGSQTCVVIATYDTEIEFESFVYESAPAAT